MPSPASPSTPTPVPTGIILWPSTAKWPAWGPTYPSAGPLGMVTVAAAYFALGVAVGALVKTSPRARRWLPLLVAPGALAAGAYILWVLAKL